MPPRDDSKPQAAVTQTPPAPAPAKAPESAPAKSGAHLLAYLESTGSGERRLKTAKAFLAEHPGATAEQVYRDMEASGVQLGTLRRAGKWTFGDAFEPDSAAMIGAPEEIDRLRQENEQLKKSLASTSAEKLSYYRQRNLALDKQNELTRQLKALKGRHSAEELMAAGIDPA